MSGTIVYTTVSGNFRVIRRGAVFIPQYWHHDRRCWKSYTTSASGREMECRSLEDAKQLNPKKK